MGKLVKFIAIIFILALVIKIIGVVMFVGPIILLIYLYSKHDGFKSSTKLKKGFITAGLLLVTLIGSGITFGGNSEGTSKVSTNTASNTTTVSQSTDKNEESIKTNEDAKRQLEEQQNSSMIAKLNLKQVTVSRVVDGDTVELSDGSKVRLIGVNTPESTTRTEQYGKQASDYTKNKLTGKTVYVEKDVSETDKYGRLLRYVWLDVPKEITDAEIKAKMFNAILVEEGYAEQSTYAPDVKYAGYFKNYAAEARNSSKGLWAIDPNGTTKGDTDVAASTNSSASSSSTASSPSSSSNSSGSSSSNSNAAVSKNTGASALGTVYFTPKGKSYHSTQGCKTLARSKTILSGSVQDAINSGHGDPCDVCVH